MRLTSRAPGRLRLTDFALAIDAALSGDADEGIAAARRSWQSIQDSGSRRRAREWLESLLLSQSRWTELLEIYEQDPTPIEPAKGLRPFARVYEGRRRRRVARWTCKEPSSITCDSAIS